jgi:hypothetical protein
MLEAIQASKECAPAFSALSSTSKCTRGLTVAQLMNRRPSAPVNRESPDSAKIDSIASSSLTTVKITSAEAVTSESRSENDVPSSVAKLRAKPGCAS